jgi:hypothetical protein
LNVRKWGFYDKTVKNFKPFCWWDAFRSVWMTQQNAPIMIMAAIRPHRFSNGRLARFHCASKPLAVLKRVTSINLWIGSREWEKLG